MSTTNRDDWRDDWQMACARHPTCKQRPSIHREGDMVRADPGEWDDYGMLTYTWLLNRELLPFEHGSYLVLDDSVSKRWLTVCVTGYNSQGSADRESEALYVV